MSQSEALLDFSGYDDLAERRREHAGSQGTGGKTKRMSRERKQSVFDGIGRLTSLILPLIVVTLAAPPALAQTASRRSSDRAAQRKGAAADFGALAKRADEAREANSPDEAAALYLRALRLKPGWKEGWWRAGAIFYERDRYADAREAFIKLVAIDRKFGPALAMLGLCEFRLRQYEPALIHLRQGNLLGMGENSELRMVARYHEAILHNRFEQFELAYDVMAP